MASERFSVTCDSDRLLVMHVFLLRDCSFGYKEISLATKFSASSLAIIGVLKQNETSLENKFMFEDVPIG